MEIKISEELNSIISFARQEAMRTGNYTIEPDHLYLGILRHRDNNACAVLEKFGLNIEEFKRVIDEKIFTAETISYSEIEHITFSRGSQNILSFTILEATRERARTATPWHLLLALSMDIRSCGTSYLRSAAVDYERLVAYGRQHNPTPETEDEDDDEKVESGMKNKDDGREHPHKKTALQEFGRDITEMAKNGKLDPTVGREDEIERVLQILGRRRKNNPMLVGDAGVGKTAIVEGIAMKIASGNAPADLLNKKIISLDMTAVVAGTKYRGEFEKRLKTIIKEITESPDIIIFMDEFHTIVGAGSAEGTLDAANILKPALARGEIRCIGATTFEEFSKRVEKDKALDRRFQKVTVMPTSIAESISILQNIQKIYERHHGVKYSDKALENCVKLSERYITDRFLPDKAIDVLDEAGSMVHLRNSMIGAKDAAAQTPQDGVPPVVAEEKQTNVPLVTADDVALVVSRMTGIPTGRIAESESSKLSNMAALLKSRVIGQDNAVETLVKSISRNRIGLKDPNKPVGAFLFIGPTGVGKTLLAKVLAEYLFDSADNLIRLDMSEYNDKFSTTRLFGPPPGYVGYEEGGQLTEKVKRKPYSVVLFDEIEKAHPDVVNVLLQIMGEGRLTDNKGQTVDLRNTVLIMTSNAGNRAAEQYGEGLGFTTSRSNGDAAKRAIVEKDLKKLFPPEFLGRIDEIVHFNALSEEDMDKITDIELRNLADRLLESGIRLQVSPAVKKLLIDRGDPKFGARPVQGSIRKLIEDPVTEYIIANGLLNDRDSATKPLEITLYVNLSPDGQDTRISSDAGAGTPPEAIRTTKEDAEAQVQKVLDELYVDNFKPHLINHVDEYTQ